MAIYPLAYSTITSDTPINIGEIIELYTNKYDLMKFQIVKKIFKTRGYSYDCFCEIELSIVI